MPEEQQSGPETTGNSNFVKKNVMISEQKTSVAIEPFFWKIIDNVLTKLTAEKGSEVTLAALMTAIDITKIKDPSDRNQNMASATRMFCLAAAGKDGGAFKGRHSELYNNVVSRIFPSNDLEIATCPLPPKEKGLVKTSLTVNEQKTSYAVEPIYERIINRVVSSEPKIRSKVALITAIDSQRREQQSLASAIREFCAAAEGMDSTLLPKNDRKFYKDVMKELTP